MLSQEREIFKNIYSKGLDKIDKLSKKIDYDDLTFIVNSSGLRTDFSKLKDPIASVDSFKNLEILIEEERYNQKEFNRYLRKNKNWKKVWKTNKKHWLILICFWTEETMLLNL